MKKDIRKIKKVLQKKEKIENLITLTFTIKPKIEIGWLDAIKMRLAGCDLNVIELLEFLRKEKIRMKKNKK